MYVNCFCCIYLRPSTPIMQPRPPILLEFLRSTFQSRRCPKKVRLKLLQRSKWKMLTPRAPNICEKMKTSVLNSSRFVINFLVLSLFLCHHILML